MEDGGPGACRWPAERDSGLVAERPVCRYIRGVARIEWVPDPGARNQPLDCRVYTTAALHGLYAASMSLAEMVEGAAVRAGATGAEDRGEVASRKAPAVARSSWRVRGSIDRGQADWLRVR